MLEFLTLITFLPVGVIVAYKKGTWKKIPTSDFVLWTAIWFLACCFIDLFIADRELFYSNDQETFVNAAVKLSSCVFKNCNDIDYRYLTQSLPAAVFISIGLEPLNVLKGLNYLCWILLFRLYYSHIYNSENSRLLKNRYLKFMFIGPTILLFTIIGNRDVIIILLFSIFLFSLYKKKHIMCFFIIIMMFTLRFQAALILIMVLVLYNFIKIRRYTFLKTIIASMAITFGCILLGQFILDMILPLYGFGNFKIASILHVEGIIFSLFNVFGLGFLFSNPETASNSVLKLLAMRVIFFDTVIYFLFAVSFLLFPRKSLSKERDIESLKTWILAVLLFYSLVSYSFDFFSTRQNLPFFYMLVLLHLMSKTTDRGVGGHEQN